jgi:hypothetical protein
VETIEFKVGDKVKLIKHCADLATPWDAVIAGQESMRCILEKCIL